MGLLEPNTRHLPRQPNDAAARREKNFAGVLSWGTIHVAAVTCNSFADYGKLRCHAEKLTAILSTRLILSKP